MGSFHAAGFDYNLPVPDFYVAFLVFIGIHL